MNNIYGEPEQVWKCHLDLIDIAIHTFQIEKKIFYLVYGFKKSHEKL